LTRAEAWLTGLSPLQRALTRQGQALKFVATVTKNKGKPALTELAFHFANRDAALGGAQFQDSTNSMPRSQGDRREWHHRMSRNEPEPELLGDPRENQRRFHQRERVANALARPAPERKVRKTRQAFQQVALPPFGTKFVRRVVPSCVAMHGPLRKGNAGTLRHRVTCNLVVLDSRPRRSHTGG
jgi:hypothetical protein